MCSVIAASTVGPGLPYALGDPRRLVDPPAVGRDQLPRNPSVPLVVVGQRRLPPGVGIPPEHSERARPIGPSTLPDAHRSTQRPPSMASGRPVSYTHLTLPTNR